MVIIGVYVVLVDVIEWGCDKKFIGWNLILLFDLVVVVFVGIVDGEFMFDLVYIEDVCVEIDMNVVVMGCGLFVEV